MQHGAQGYTANLLMVCKWHKHIFKSFLGKGAQEQCFPCILVMKVIVFPAFQPLEVPRKTFKYTNKSLKSINIYKHMSEIFMKHLKIITKMSWKILVACLEIMNELSLRHCSTCESRVRGLTQVALLHQRLHVVNPDPRLHSAAETAWWWLEDREDLNLWIILIQLWQI